MIAAGGYHYCLGYLLSSKDLVICLHTKPGACQQESHDFGLVCRKLQVFSKVEEQREEASLGVYCNVRLGYSSMLSAVKRFSNSASILVNNGKNYQQRTVRLRSCSLRKTAEKKLFSSSFAIRQERHERQKRGSFLKASLTGATKQGPI